MQVFLSNENLQQSATELDDLRLNKQITEINQILLTYVNKGGGHANHPVNVWYKSSQGILYLLEYQHRLCVEYSYRFMKFHMGYFTYRGLIDFLTEDEGTPCKDRYCVFYTSREISNFCRLFECENFRTYTKKNPCTIVSDDFVAIEDCEPFGIVKGENLLLR